MTHRVEIRLHHVQDIEGVRRYWRQWFDAWEESRMDPEEMIDFQDRTLLLGWTRCRAAGSGLEMEQPTGWLMTWGRRVVIRHEEWWDRAAALEAVGLSA
jgi:hypothetical protein